MPNSRAACGRVVWLLVRALLQGATPWGFVHTCISILFVGPPDVRRMALGRGRASSHCSGFSPGALSLYLCVSRSQVRSCRFCLRSCQPRRSCKAKQSLSCTAKQALSAFDLRPSICCCRCCPQVATDVLRQPAGGDMPVGVDASLVKLSGAGFLGHTVSRAAPVFPRSVQTIVFPGSLACCFASCGCSSAQRLQPRLSSTHNKCSPDALLYPFNTCSAPCC